jgi:hypothetical protein
MLALCGDFTGPTTDLLTHCALSQVFLHYAALSPGKPTSNPLFGPSPDDAWGSGPWAMDKGDAFAAESARTRRSLW